MSDCRKCQRFNACYFDSDDCIGFVQKPLTKGDSIRSMTDEELAKWIQNRLDDYDGQSTWECWLKWLKQEVE